MKPTYKTYFISQRVKLGGGLSELDPKIQAVLDGVPPERIVSITHTFTPGLLTVLIVLRTDERAPTD